ncbi:MAG TPA: branched-chain amino acid ABC transporter permease, partial [Acidimicrobiales bacterium]|nr:branched-chain amino acid ABC transporter permease [Acidimicrobiales bacterium]
MPRLRNLNMSLRYEDDLKLFKSRWSRAGVVALLILMVLFPLMYTDDFWIGVLNSAGIAAIGAIGLNLLTGYAGQVSLGHAFFIGVGAYSAVFFGGQHNLPLPVWLLGAAAVGGLVGAVIGPFALRLRGNYLAVVSLGLVFLGIHVFKNWESITGGPGGTGVTPPLTLGPVNFAKLQLGGYTYTRNQGFFLLIWPLVALTALLAKNVVRSRPGRAMQAVRDRDVAAEVIGVSLARYKISAFILSSALASMAGALFGAYQQFVTPENSFNLDLSILYIAIIIVGGVGTIFGSILGAVFVGAVPEVVAKFSDKIPLVSSSPS